MQFCEDLTTTKAVVRTTEKWRTSESKEGRHPPNLSATSRFARTTHNVTPGAGNVVSVEAPHGSRVRAAAETKYAYTATAYATSVAGPPHFGRGRAEMVDIEINLPNGKFGAYKQVNAGALLKAVE